MSKIDTSKWEEFNIGDIFEASNTGNILLREISDGSGTTPYVTASSINNGVVAYIDASNYSIIKGNCILVGGKTFTLTYQKDDFVSNDSHNFEMHIIAGSPNEYTYLFLISALRATFEHKYYWGDAVTKDKILSEKIRLPVDENHQPDFSYMEEYMKNREIEVSEAIFKIKKCQC